MSDKYSVLEILSQAERIFPSGCHAGDRIYPDTVFHPPRGPPHEAAQPPRYFGEDFNVIQNQEMYLLEINCVNFDNAFQCVQFD
jgi:hypothetical protein